MITGLIAAGIVAIAGCSSSKASTSAASKPSKVTLVVYGCGWRSPGWSERPGRPRSTSPTTRPRRSPWPTGFGILERGRLIQQGPPEEIYTGPATPFVARFTRLSGELPVQVRGRATDGTVEVELARPAQARLFHARGLSRAVGEAAGLLMIRQTGVDLCAIHADEHHIAGTAADGAFRGRGYEHAIDIPGLGRLSGVFSDARAERGEHVGLRLDPRGCHLFSAGPEGAARPSNLVAVSHLGPDHA